MTKFNAAFWRWFGKSKVVDAEGRPLVVYHGTNRKFWEFKESLPERLGDPEGVVAGRCRMGGFYFTTDKRIARGFGKRVIAAYLRAERIFDYENPRQIEVLVRYLRTLPTFAAWDERDVRDGDWKIMERSEELQDFLRARYDSYFVNEHAPEGYANKSIVVFSPAQIKSATANRGTWSPTDPDIRRNPQQFQKAYSPAQIMSIYRSGKIPLDGRKVDAMVRWLRAGKKLPAIVRDKKTGDIIDGMHRAAATEEFERDIRRNPEGWKLYVKRGYCDICKSEPVEVFEHPGWPHACAVCIPKWEAHVKRSAAEDELWSKYLQFRRESGRETYFGDMARHDRAKAEFLEAFKGGKGYVLKKAFEEWLNKPKQNPAREYVEVTLQTPTGKRRSWAEVIRRGKLVIYRCLDREGSRTGEMFVAKPGEAVEKRAKMSLKYGTFEIAENPARAYTDKFFPSGGS